jgi:putative heme-binding domain-containing protein
MSKNSLNLLCVFCVLGVGAISRAQQAAPDPEKERQSFKVADGFEVSLYAADPMMAKPIQMNFDPAGRLWVATSEVYPQIKPGQVADDKVLVLEDTNGDHKADKVTTFAHGLLIPTGVLPGDGGCYVANSTEIVHFKDTDGDGKSDQKRVILSGFGTEDTHHIIHTFRWGPDGTFYFNQSVYIHSYVETPWGPRTLRAGGTWAFRPDSDRLEIFSRGLINHWGHAWDKYGDSFMTDGAGDGGVHFAFPGVSFWSLNDQSPRILHPDTHGLNKGSPKFAGAEIISGRHFPDDWQGDLITNDFRAHRTVRFKLSEDGSGFASKPMPDLIKSTDQAYRPVDIKMGPDGALYIADWYNPIINHGEVDFRDPRRDKTHGRIWRVTAKGRPLVERPKLAGASIEQLLEQLKSPEAYTRQQARLAMREMDHVQVATALVKWASAIDRSTPAGEFNLLQGLWTAQTINAIDTDTLAKLLQAKDPGVRAAAVRVAGAWMPNLFPATHPGVGIGDPFEAFERLVNDPHPRVRLEAVLALAKIKDPRAMNLALQVLNHPMDQFLDYALYLTANDLEPVWLPKFLSGELTFDHNPKKIEFALKAIRNPAAIKPVVEQFKSGNLPVDARRDYAELLGSLGGPDQITLLFNTAIASDTDKSLRLAILNALDRAARLRNIKPKADSAALKPLLAPESDEPTRIAALHLAGALKAAELHDTILAIASSTDHPAQIPAALDALADLGGAQAIKDLRTIGADDKRPDVQLQAAAALAALDINAAATIAARGLSNGPDANLNLTPIYSAFLKRKTGPDALGAALKTAKLKPDVAKLSLRAVYAQGHAEPAIIEPLQSAAGIGAQAKALSPAEMKNLIAEVQSKGDPVKGEAIFRRADTACMRCHSIAGAGGSLAPDLLSLGASAPLDYIIESVLLPSKAIKEGYHAIIVETKDGDQLTGIKVRQTDKDLILRDAVSDEIVIPLNTIKGKPREGGSMMPAGLADPLTHQELVDLIRFLSELGRPGPFAVGPQQLARRWQILDPAPANIKPGEKLDLSSASWSPAYAQVSGTLPTPNNPILAQAEINVTTAGPMRILTTLPQNTPLWIDDQPTPSAPELSVTLTQGLHTITLAPPANSTLRLELTETPGSPAKAQFVTGR